jgi:hypothetical protein
MITDSSKDYIDESILMNCDFGSDATIEDAISHIRNNYGVYASKCEVSVSDEETINGYTNTKSFLYTPKVTPMEEL